MNIETRKKIIELVKCEVVPALGCTEPIAVALAVVAAREALPEGVCCSSLEVAVSPNIYKNGMGVGVPGTGENGLAIAAALACFTGTKADKLEVLKGVTPEIVKKAKDFCAAGKVRIYPEESTDILHVRAVCRSENFTTEAVINHSHTNIVSIKLNGGIVYSGNSETAEESTGENTHRLSVETIYEFSETAPLEEIEFITEGAEMNKRLSELGLSENTPNCIMLGVGKSIKKRLDNCKKLCGRDDLMLEAMARTAAASDARMAGAMLPAMSNSGSGNQGITVMMPIVAAADVLGVSHEKYVRALMLGNLISILIKQNFGKLSAACGCVVASTGAACGITYLLGGTCEQIKYAVKNMTATLTGMICDGAKPGCALKVASGTAAAVQSAFYAIDGICVSGNDGIIDCDVEKTIQNVGTIASKAMCQTDREILRIMENKNS